MKFIKLIIFSLLIVFNFNQQMAAQEDSVIIHYKNGLSKSYAVDEVQFKFTDGKTSIYSSREIKKILFEHINNIEEGINDVSVFSYPNPFDNYTTIQFQLDIPSDVNLIITNLDGIVVNSMFYNRLETGSHSYIWTGLDLNGSKVPAGVYIYKIITPYHTKVGKLTLINY
jgi:hypothetical protein